MDTPARCFVTGTKGHNAVSACHKCEQKGKSIDRTMTFDTKVGNARTDTSFINRNDVDHHLTEYQERLSLLETAYINRFPNFPSNQCIF